MKKTLNEQISLTDSIMCNFLNGEKVNGEFGICRMGKKKVIFLTQVSTTLVYQICVNIINLRISSDSDYYNL